MSRPEAPIEKMIDKAFTEEFEDIKRQQDKAQFKGTKITYHQDKVDKQAALRCPKCGGEVFNRRMDVSAVDQAFYEDGRLKLKSDHKYEVHESDIACDNCEYDFDEVEHEQLLAQIEEMFL